METKEQEKLCLISREAISMILRDLEKMDKCIDTLVARSFSHELNSKTKENIKTDTGYIDLCLDVFRTKIHHIQKAVKK